MVELLLKNTMDTVLVDDHVAEFIKNDPQLQEMKFELHLRQHSHGYAFYQKSIKIKQGVYKVKTLYLHKVIAEKFCPKPEGLSDYLVMFKNDNKLDCRTENLFWADRSILQRIHQKPSSKTGYKGVFKEGKQYKTQIYIRKEQIIVGKYDTAEEAALAYNKKIKEVYGDIPVFMNEVPN